ncbi:MAG: chaperonin GroEL [Chloroflexota bacterium]
MHPLTNPSGHLDPNIIAGDLARKRLLHGVDLMAGLLRPTLGPLARTVAITRLVGSDPPEVLDRAATIARRTIQLPDPFDSVGAMMMRHVAWRVSERVGDGAATAAVLTQSLAHAIGRYIAAGGNPVSINEGLARAARVVQDELRSMAWELDGPEEIGAAVRGTLRDDRLAEIIGEIVDSVGPDGAILVEDTSANDTSYEYIDGVRWPEGFVSSFLLDDTETTLRVLEPRILCTDHHLERAEQLLPALEACIAAGERRLMVIAPEIKDAVVGLLLVNKQRGVLESVVAVKAPSIGDQRQRILEDLAVITGGRCIRNDAGERLEDVTLADLGSARQAWATRVAFGILGGRGDRAAIRERISAAKHELSTVMDDAYLREKVRERIGKLSGTGAVIRVGAASKSAQEELKLRVEAAVTAARHTLQDGVVAGGGSALVGCIPAVEALGLAGDAGYGAEALCHALGEPIRVIAANAGYPSSTVVHDARRRGPDWVFDVSVGEWVQAREAGVVDPLPVVAAALEAAVSLAMMIGTSEVVVHRVKNAPLSVEP